MNNYESLCAILGILGLVPGCGGSEETVALAKQGVTAARVSATVAVTSRWQGGYCASVSLHNDMSHAIAGWIVQLQTNATSTTNVWNGTASFSNGQLKVTPVDNNAWVGPAGSVEFGFCSAGTTGNPVLVSADGVDVGTVSDGLSASVETTSDWAAGYCANVVVTNGTTATMATWGVVLELGAATKSNVWNAAYSTSGSRLSLIPLSYNTMLKPGTSTVVGFCADKNGSNVKPTVTNPVPMPRRCGTIAGLGCATGEYCDLGTGACAIADAAGVCETKPSVCPMLVAPVCGCDGQTYSNACEAAMAGVSIDRDGTCRPSCTNNSACDTRTEYCALPVAACLIESPTAQLGECKSKPLTCVEVFAPVCGCDGRQYGNDCEAAAAGVNVATLTTCGVKSP